MKYKIVVEKENEQLFTAYCPVMTNIQASGTTIDGALSNIRQEMLCYLHDPKAEFEIVFEGRAARDDSNTLRGAV